MSARCKLRFRLLLALVLGVAAAAAAVSEAPAAAKEAFIEDVNAKQLERMLAEKDYVAVFWCKCRFTFIQSALLICSA